MAPDYPFLPPEVIAMSNAQHDADEAPTTEPAKAAPAPERGRRRGANRAHVPGENTAHRQSEDRS